MEYIYQVIFGWWFPFIQVYSERSCLVWLGIDFSAEVLLHAKEIMKNFSTKMRPLENLYDGLYGDGEIIKYRWSYWKSTFNNHAQS